MLAVHLSSHSHDEHVEEILSESSASSQSSSSSSSSRSSDSSSSSVSSTSSLSSVSSASSSSTSSESGSSQSSSVSSSSSQSSSSSSQSSASSVSSISSSQSSSSSVTLWTPEDEPTAWAWYDTDDPTTIVEFGGAVLGHTEKINRNADLIQGIIAKRPTLTQINGTGAFAYDAANDQILVADSDGLSGNPALTIGVVRLANTNQDLADRLVQLGTTAGVAVGITTGTQGLSWRFNDGSERYSATNLGVAEIQIGVRPLGGDYEDSKMFLNGVEQVRTGGGGDNNTPNLGISVSIGGGFGAGGAEGIYFDGIIGDVIVAETSDPNFRLLLEGFLAHKYGLTALLPVSNPYKFNPPTI